MQIDAEMSEMDMGVGAFPLTLEDQEMFRGSAELTMSGQWRIVVQAITPDDPYHFHETYTFIPISV